MIGQMTSLFNVNNAKSCMLQGIKRGNRDPNPHLHQSLAVLAGEMGFIEEARAWFSPGHGKRFEYNTCLPRSVVGSDNQRRTSQHRYTL